MEDLLLVRTPTRPQQSPWNGGRPKRTRRGPQAVRSVGRKDDRVAGAVQRRHHLDGVRIGREPISARPALVPAQRLAVFQVELLGRAVPQVVGSETVHRQVDAVRLAVLHKKNNCIVIVRWRQVKDQVNLSPSRSILFHSQSTTAQSMCGGAHCDGEQSLIDGRLSKE